MNFLGNILCQFYAWAKVIFLKVRQLTVNYNLKLLKPYLLQIAPSMTALCKGNFVYWHIFSKWDYRNTFSYGRWDWRAGSLGRLIRQTWHVWAFLYRDRRIFVSVRNSHGDHKQEGWESKRREKRSHSSYLRRDWEPKTILFSTLFKAACILQSPCGLIYIGLPVTSSQRLSFSNTTWDGPGSRVWRRRVVANFGGGGAALWRRRSMSCVLSVTQ